MSNVQCVEHLVILINVADASFGFVKNICSDIEIARKENNMVMVEPWYPQRPFDQPPYDPFPSFPLDFGGNYTVERIKEVEKKWKERHVKDVKKGILITFEGNEQPLFIATDDKCWSKIMEAVKDEPKNDK